MGSNRVEPHISRDLYYHGNGGVNSFVPLASSHLSQRYYTTTSPIQKPPQPKGSINYFKEAKPSLNFLEQMTGFNLSPGETAILGGLFLLASPVIIPFAFAGCGKDSVPKASEGLCGGVICALENSVALCVQNKCRIDRCLDGFSNTNGLEEDGCECKVAQGGCNHPPELEEIGNKTIREGEELRFRVNATDPDGDELQFFIENLPHGASFNNVTQTFIWTPTFEQAGLYEGIRFTVKDSRLASDKEAISITVTDTNRPPILTEIGNKIVNENETLEFILTAADADGDNLTYTARGLPEGATLDAVTGRFSWKPTFFQAGEYRITFTVTDDRLLHLSDSQEVVIAVNNFNHPPEMDSIPNQNVNEGAMLVVPVRATDPDRETLTFRGNDLPAGARVDPTTGTLTWTPTFAQAEVYRNVGITVSDGDLSVTQRFDINVSNINRVPVIDPISNQTVRENQLLTVEVRAIDPDGDALTFGGDNLPAGARVNPTTGALTWTPTSAQAGVHRNVGITASDSDWGVTQRFDITVNINRAPVMDPIPNQTVREDQLLRVRVRAIDPDGDALTFGGDNLPTGAEVNPRTGTLTWTPTFDEAGVYTNVEIIATDGVRSSNQRFDITVTNTNRVPVIDPISNQTVRENQLLTMEVRAIDPDGDALTFGGDNLPTGARVNPTTGALTWTPTFAQAGVYRNVGVTASDSDLSVTQRFDITVDENRAPTFTIGNKIAETGVEFAFTLPGSDPDGHTLTYSAVGLPTGATLNASTGAFTWTPTIAQLGNHEITFEVTDGDLVARETIRIEVRGVREIQESRITNNEALSEESSLVWTGSEFGVAWMDNRDHPSDFSDFPELYFARLSATGTKIGDDVRVTNSDGGRAMPSLVWTGSEFGVAWERGSEIYFARLSATGTKIGDDVRITNSGTFLLANLPSLVWTGSEFGVAWEEWSRDGWLIKFARLSATGTVIDETWLSDRRSPYELMAPSLVWTGSEFGVAWTERRSDSSSVHFARLSATGTRIGGDVNVSLFPSSSLPSLVWTGSEFGVAWKEFIAGGFSDIYFARLSATGTKIGYNVKINNVDSEGGGVPSLVWTGSEFGVAWMWRGSRNPAIYFARISDTGTKTGNSVRVTNATTSFSLLPSLVWTGSEFGVAWEDYRDANGEIYFARILGTFAR